jgi:hypothetical protein
MIITTILGSPRRAGNTAKVLKAFERLAAADHDVSGSISQKKPSGGAWAAMPVNGTRMHWAADKTTTSETSSAAFCVPISSSIPPRCTCGISRPR